MIGIFSEISHQKDKANVFLKENSVKIEEFIIKNNVIELTNTLKALSSNTAYKVDLAYKNEKSDNVKIVLGDISSKARLSRTSWYPINVNNFKIADVYIHQDIGKLNYVIFKKNIFFYFYLALFLTFFIYMVNYDIHDSVANLKTNLTAVLRKLENKESNVLSEIELRSRKEGLEHDLYKVIATFVEELNSLKELEKDHELTKKVNELALKFSHDMKSPISTLNTLLDHPDQLNENAELLKIVTARINDISTNLLDKRRDLRVEQFKLDALMEELIPQKEKEFKLLPHETIRVESSGNTLIEANKSEVSRLLSNLINNSIEASREVGRPLINISCSQEEGLVKLEIEDNGKGIDENAIPAILQGKFSEKENGNGIGVSSAKKYLTSIGGDLLMVSQIGQGTKVTVQFPRIH